MRKTLSFLTGETTRVFNLLAPGPPLRECTKPNPAIETGAGGNLT